MRTLLKFGIVSLYLGYESGEEIDPRIRFIEEARDAIARVSTSGRSDVRSRFLCHRFYEQRGRWHRLTRNFLSL